MSFALSVSKRDAAWPAAALAAFVFCPAGLLKFFFLGVGIWLAKRLAGEPASSFRKNFPLILFLIEMRKLRPDARFALANTPLELAGGGTSISSASAGMPRPRSSLVTGTWVTLALLTFQPAAEP